MIGSAVWAGREPLEQAHQLQEVGGTATVKSELERIGYLGDTPASYEAMPIAAHFELYIDQANKLAATGNKIGVVSRAKTWRWYTIDVYGRGLLSNPPLASISASASLANLSIC